MVATISEKRRSSGIDQTPGPETHLHQDINILADNMQALEPDVLEATDHAKTMSPEEVEEIIDYILNEHGKDLIFPPRVIEAARRYRFDDNVKSDPVEHQRIYEELKVEAALLVINSPYAEVRAVVDNHDDPTAPASTFRAWFIGTIFVTAGAFVNEFFSIRQPGISVTPNVFQLFAFPAGKLLEAILPTKQFTTFGYAWSLNPGKFNLKEHMVITIMAQVGFITTPYSDSIIWVQYLPLYFNQPWAANFGYQITVALSTNFIGYGLAGLTRRFLVYPSQAVWPTNLATIAFLRSFHTESNNVVNGWAISRMGWTMCCFAAMFVYFWFPNYILQAMSYFNWITWIAPKNVKLAAIAGSVSGLGFNPLPTFDWNQLIIADPLITPFFSTMNIFLGAFFTLPIIAVTWLTNTWYTGHLPINSNLVFDNTGQNYEVARAVDDNTLFDEASYKAYSPIYLSAGNSVNYGVFFGMYTSTITHTILYHRREVVSSCKNLITRKSAFANSKDVHIRLMRSYEEVPEWVYLIVLCASIGIGAAGIAAYPTNTTPAAALYGVFLATTFCVPCGIVMATANVEIPLNVIAELCGGLWFPGNATAMLYFKCYGLVTTWHTLHFAQDLKLAHYIHIPPWVTFNCQMFATLVSTFVSTAILNYLMTAIPDICTVDQKDHFTCPGTNTFFTAAVLWGTLGPKKMFGTGAIYNGILWSFLLGALLPIPFYLLGRKWKVFQYIHTPAFLYGGSFWAPFNLSNIWPAVPVAWLFNYYIKRRYLGWWCKYNYITTSAFTCAIAVSALVIFFSLQQHDIEIDWIGNTRPFDGCDGSGCVLYPIPEGSHFGPGPGEF